MPSHPPTRAGLGLTAEHLIKHVITTLPDSMTERLAVLRDLVAVLPPRNAYRTEVVRVLMKLESHDQLQRELPLLFTK